MELFPLTKQTLRNLVTRSISYKSSLGNERKTRKRSGGYYDISQPHLVGFHPSAKGDFPREVEINNMPQRARRGGYFYEKAFPVP